MLLSLVIHRCRAKLNCLPAEQCGEAELLAGNRAVGFEISFVILCGEYLAKSILKITPRARLIVHIYFLKRAILGVLPTKQDPAVKRIPQQS